MSLSRNAMDELATQSYRSGSCGSKLITPESLRSPIRGKGRAATDHGHGKSMQPISHGRSDRESGRGRRVNRNTSPDSEEKNARQWTGRWPDAWKKQPTGVLSREWPAQERASERAFPAVALEANGAAEWTGGDMTPLVTSDSRHPDGECVEGFAARKNVRLEEEDRRGAAREGEGKPRSDAPEPPRATFLLELEKRINQVRLTHGRNPDPDSTLQG